MARALALVLLLFVVGEATGSLEFALGDDCRTASAPCDASCPACVLCSCCPVHSATSQSAARLQVRPDRVAFVSGDTLAVPASHCTSPLRHPPKSSRA
jgi:hypothetical protein